MTDQPPESTPIPPPPDAPNGIAAYRWPITFALVALLALVGYVISLKTAERAALGSISGIQNAASKVAERTEAIAARFRQGTITQTFTAAIPELTSTGMGNLELATAKVTESFTRTDARTAAWDMVYLGTTVTEIKVPVTYRYHVRLADPWHLDVSGQTCVVIAPRLQPSLPPAIHTEHLEKRSDRGWARFDTAEQMAELERSITPTLRRYAADDRHLALVREECRKTVAEFVRNWLLKEDHWRTDRFHTITVVFADEPNVDLDLIKPTIRLAE